MRFLLPKGINLWPHQRNAVELVLNYLQEYDSRKNTGGALLHLPTGTGKTGILAVAARAIDPKNTVLLVVPSTALRAQIYQEVLTGFFDKVSTGYTPSPKQVIQIDSAKELDRIDYSQPFVAVCTFQMLETQARKNPERILRLRESIDFVMIDEGHYEPAPKWGAVIRSLEKPRILLSATPFRNDLKQFSIDEKYSFSFPYSNAQNLGYVRKVQFIDISSPRDPDSFASQLLKIYKQTFNQEPVGENAPRVIVRCSTSQSIRKIGEALRNSGVKVAMIHQTYSRDDDSDEHKRVPVPKDSDSIFWIHQYKCLEGIDDPRFQMAAIYEPLSNARSLVQQIGRIVRNPRLDPADKAYVVHFESDGQRELWESFVEYDELLKTSGIKAVDYAARITEAIGKGAPKLAYFDGRFRKTLNMTQIDSDEVVIPTSAKVFRIKENRPIGSPDEVFEELFLDADVVWRKIWSKENGVAFLYIGIANSPILSESLFVEPYLGIVVANKIDENLFIYDSHGLTSKLDRSSFEQISPFVMQRLFPDRNDTHVTSVSLKSSNFGIDALRARSISAVDIGNLSPSFDDHAFECSTARGYIRGSTIESDENTSLRRYVGFSGGRITDSRHARVSLGEFFEWTKGVHNLLNTKSVPSQTFRRYARPVDPPQDARARNILLDLEEVQDNFLYIENKSKKEYLTPEEVCVPVDQESGEFSVKMNGVDHLCKITFDGKRYLISSRDLDRRYHSDQILEGITGYLNGIQSFRVIPNGLNVFYSGGSFYSPIIEFGPKYDDSKIGLEKILEGHGFLKDVVSEKGNGKGRTKWEAGCLFDVIDRRGKGLSIEKEFGKPELLICDDMGAEIADFIFASKKENRVVFVHAKSNRGIEKQYSATALQDVCAQAKKNLMYIGRHGTATEPKRARNWHSQKWKNGKQTIDKRIRLGGNISGTKAWDQIVTMMRDPTCDIEVWLLLGKLLSKKSLFQQLKASKPHPAAQQSAYLIFSTLNAAQSVGGKLRVFCSP